MRVRPQRTALYMHFHKCTKKGERDFSPSQTTSQLEARSNVPGTQRAFLSDLQATADTHPGPHSWPWLGRGVSLLSGERWRQKVREVLVHKHL